MKKQRNYSQLKEQEKSPEKTNNEIDLTSLLDSEFEKQVIKTLKELRKTINRNADHCNRELETIKRNQSNHPIRTADRKTNEKKKNQSNIWDLWDNIKHTNLHITGCNLSWGWTGRGGTNERLALGVGTGTAHSIFPSGRRINQRLSLRPEPE